ncbi:MAG: peptide deformylase [Nitrospirae bacterium]|nr:peptide deformylase [Nitrospirota bacterium]
MAVLEIKKYPDTILTEKAVSVDGLSKRHLRLIDNMIETMYAAPGIGLAAPQVGVSERIIVTDISKADELSSLVVLVNPEIVLKEGLIESDEGCLSVPGLTVNIKRAERVIVRGLDRNGKAIEIQAEGLLSRVLQHEIDHIDGILILNRISFIKREFYKKRLHKTALTVK